MIVMSVYTNGKEAKGCEVIKDDNSVPVVEINLGKGSTDGDECDGKRGQENDSTISGRWYASDVKTSVSCSPKRKITRSGTTNVTNTDQNTNLGLRPLVTRVRVAANSEINQTLRIDYFNREYIFNNNEHNEEHRKLHKSSLKNIPYRSNLNERKFDRQTTHSDCKLYSNVITKNEDIDNSLVKICSNEKLFRRSDLNRKPRRIPNKRKYGHKYLKTDSIENSFSISEIQTPAVEIKFDKSLNSNSSEIKKTATFESSNDFNVNIHTENDENPNAQIDKGHFGVDSTSQNKDFQKFIRRKTKCLRKGLIFRSKDPLRRSRSYDTIYLNGVKSSLNSWLNFQMADDSIDDECAKVNKLSDIKRSLSSWSLSAIKKHRLSTPRFAGVTLFQGKKKGTNDEEKPSSPSSRKVQLLKEQRQKIKNRFKNVTAKDSPKSSSPSTEVSPISNGTETIEKYKNHNETSKVCDSDDKITFIDDEEDLSKMNAKTPSSDVARDSLTHQDTYADQWWDADDHTTSEKEKNSHEIKNKKSLNPFYEDADLSSLGEKSSSECKDTSIYADVDMETVSGQINGVVSPVVMKEQFKDPRYGSDKEESLNLEKKMELARTESIRKTIKVKTKIGFGGIVDSLSETFRKNDLILAFSPTAIASKSRAKKDEIDDSLDEDTVNYYKKQSDGLQSDNSSGSDWKKSIYSTMHPKENWEHDESITDNRVEKEVENQTNIIFKIEDLGEQNSLKCDATDMEVPSVVDLRSEIENDEKKTNMKEISKTLKSFTDSIFKEKGNRNAADNRKKYMLGAIMNSNSKFATKYLESKNSRLDPSAFPKIIVTPSSFDDSSSSVESPSEIINHFEKNPNNDSDNTRKPNNLPDFDVILNESNTNLEALKDDNMTEGSSCFQSVMDDQQHLVQDFDHTEEFLRDNDDDNETTFFSVGNSVYGKNDGYSSESDLEILKKVGIIRSESDIDVLELNVKERYSSPFGSSKASSSETLANVTLSSEDTLNNESNAKSKSQNDNDLDSMLLDCSLKKCENIPDFGLGSKSIDCTSEVQSQIDNLIQPHLQYHLSDQTVNSEDHKTMIIEKPSIEVSSVPKPSPRTKKGKGIYQSKVELLHESSIDLQKVKSSSSNYNDTDLKDPDTGENIYCEIGDPKPNGPRPTPRSRKNKRENNYRGSCSSVVNIDSKSSSSSVTLNSSQKSIPDWIAKRSPIPCPRKQKQTSLASLPAALINETPKSVLPNQSPVRKVTMKGSEPTAWEGDDFYYGKAASIAYGISSHHTSQPPSTDSGIFCQVENHYEFIGEKNNQIMAGTNKVDTPDRNSVAITKENSVDILNVNRIDTPDGNKVSTRDLVEEVASPLQKPVRKRRKTLTKSDNIVQTVKESTDRKGRDSLQQLFFGSLGTALDATASVDGREGAVRRLNHNNDKENSVLSPCEKKLPDAKCIDERKDLENGTQYRDIEFEEGLYPKMLRDRFHTINQSLFNPSRSEGIVITLNDEECKEQLTFNSSLGVQCHSGKNNNNNNNLDVNVVQEHEGFLEGHSSSLEHVHCSNKDTNIFAPGEIGNIDYSVFSTTGLEESKQTNDFRVDEVNWLHGRERVVDDVTEVMVEDQQEEGDYSKMSSVSNCSRSQTVAVNTASVEARTNLFLNMAGAESSSSLIVKTVSAADVNVSENKVSTKRQLFKKMFSDKAIGSKPAVKLVKQISKSWDNVSEEETKQKKANANRTSVSQGCLNATLHDADSNLKCSESLASLLLLSASFYPDLSKLVKESKPSKEKEKRKTSSGSTSAVGTLSLISSQLAKNAFEATYDKAEEMEQHSQTESLLVEVLYAIHNTAGSTPASTWLLYHHKLASINGFPPPNGGESSPPSPRKVTFGDVCSNLQETFGVEEQMLVKCLDQAKRMERMQLQLRVNILSARDLRMKSVDGTANPYVTLSVPGDCHRTKLLHQTRAPVWDQTFSLHEYKHQGVGAVKEVKDLKALGRLMKGTKAQERHLLGTVNIDLKDILEDGICGWYPLIKDEQISTASHLSGSTSNLSNNGDHNFTTSISNQLAHFKQSGAALLHHSTGDSSSTHHRNEQKQRGEIYLSANWSTSRPVPSGVKRPYDALLAKNMIAYLKDLQPGRIWGGSLPPGALCSLHLLGVVEDISGGQRALSIWNIASRAGLAVDNGWLLELLEIIEKNLKNNNYTTEEKKTLSDSLKSWFEESEYRLSHLEESFSQSAGVTHSHQLSYLLKSLKLISKSSDFQPLVSEGGKDGATYDVTEVVKRAIEKYATAWWINLLERELKDSLSPEEQVKRVINITDECYLLIASATSFYSPVIVSEVNVPYLRIIYLFITKKLNPCVRPLLMNVYNRLLSSHSPHEDSEAKSDYALSAGTDLWQLYINLGRIHKQGQNMPQEVRQESGVKDYHRWFSKGVMHWLQVAQTRIQKIITNAVSADHLTPCDEYCDFSSSATDAITVFIGVRNWWLELSWPDIQNSCVLLGKILEDLCSSATFYCDQLKDKVHHIYTAQKNDKKVFITKQICIGLNNIERVRDEVAKLPDHFKISDILKELSKGSNTPNPFSSDAEEDGKAAADHFRGTFERIVSSASENMEMKVTEFVDTVTEKVTDIVSNGLTAACEASDPSLLLVEVLDPGLGLMRNSLQKKNFERFLDKFWNILLSLIRNVVDRNVERRNSSFFEGVFEILTSSLQFFTPSGGLAVEEAMNEDYYRLVERLELLRLSSECLISQYYRQRSKEEEACKGELFVTVFFTRSQKLVVEVVMAKNMKGDDENRNSLANPGSHLPIDPYVKIQLVPQDWFPGALTNSTKVLKKSDPATFQETFSYVLSPEDSNVSESFILLTLKDHNLARSNTFIGESLVSLGSVPLIESDSIMSQPKPLTLKLTKPGIEAGYKAINTLRHRSTTTDRVASAFMKKVGGRFADARGRKESRDNNHLHGGSTDDEKTPGGRSPKLLDKLKMKIEIT